MNGLPRVPQSMAAVVTRVDSTDAVPVHGCETADRVEH